MRPVARPELPHPRSAIPGRLIVRMWSPLVPQPLRAAWRAEWEGELGWLAGPAPGRVDLGTRVRAWRCALAALRDALWFRHRHGRQLVTARDLRFALRSLRQRPGFSLAVILTLGIGIGGTTAIFSVVDAVLLRPLPYYEPERLVDVWRMLPNGFAVPGIEEERLDFWADAGLFAELEARGDDEVFLTGFGEPKQLEASFLTSGVFAMLGVPPLRGRVFTPDEVARDARVAVVSEDFWRTTLGADPRMSGTTITLNDEPYEVIGVMPRRFRFPLGGRSVWLPLDIDSGRNVQGLARLADGVPLELARERITTIAEAANAEQPRPMGWGIRLSPVDDRSLGEGDDRALWLLGSAVFAVLLIGCANAANLLLVAGAARSRELAIRRALGATRRRLIGAMLTEVAVLVGAATVLGVSLSVVAVDVMRAISPSSYAIFGANAFTVDLRVLAFAVGVATLTGLLFGVGPSVTATRHRSAMPGADRSSTSSPGLTRARGALVTGELALAMGLLVSASLLIRSFANQMETDLGVTTDDVVVWTLEALPSHRYPDGAARLALVTELAERLRSVPGVRQVSVAEDVPPAGGFSFGVTIQAEGAEPSDEGQPAVIPINRVDGAYFDVLGLPLLAGRGFTPQDGPDNPPVAIIDKDLAAFLWPDVQAAGVVGRRFRVRATDEWQTVVGVVPDLVLLGVDGQLDALCGDRCKYELYRPVWQSSRLSSPSLVMRTTAGAPALAGQVRSLLWSVDPTLPAGRLETMEDRMHEELAQPRFVLRLVTIFTLLAVGLAAMGVYAVLSYAVAQRTREFGVRIAIGARTDHLVRAVLSKGLQLALLGTALGAAVALAGGRLLASLLHGIAQNDPWAFATAGAALMAVALVASIVPARRAMRVSPTEALRME